MHRSEKNPVLALVVSEFPRLSESFIVSKFLGLLERGWNVHVVCDRSSGEAWDAQPDLRARPELRRRVHAAWPHRPRMLAAALVPAAVLRCLARAPATTLRYLVAGGRTRGLGVLRRLYLDAELLALAPDLVHFEFGSLAAARTHLGASLGTRLVVSFRGYDLNRVGLDSPDHYSSVWRRADALHFLSGALWETAQRRGCPADARHVLIPPAIDACRFDPGRRHHREVAGTVTRPLRILSVGRLAWEKGHEHALQAVRLLLDLGVEFELRLIGAGDHLEAVAWARHELGLEDRVHLLGAGHAEDVREQMLWADVLLHAAVSEGFSNAVLEAQAMALPVVATDAGGLPENIVDRVTGRIVPRRDPPAVARALRELAGDPELRQRLGNGGRKRVQEHFQPGAQIAAFERLYKGLLRDTALAMTVD